MTEKTTHNEDKGFIDGMPSTYPILLDLYKKYEMWTDSDSATSTIDNLLYTDNNPWYDTENTETSREHILRGHMTETYNRVLATRDHIHMQYLKKQLDVIPSMDSCYLEKIQIWIQEQFLPIYQQIADAISQKLELDPPILLTIDDLTVKPIKADHKKIVWDYQIIVPKLSRYGQRYIPMLKEKQSKFEEKPYYTDNIQIINMYLNIRFDTSVLRSHIDDLLKLGEKWLYGENDTGKNKRVLIDGAEWSVNLWKPPHFWHNRPAIISEAIGNLYKANGYETHWINHVNDRWWFSNIMTWYEIRWERINRKLIKNEQPNWDDSSLINKLQNPDTTRTAEIMWKVYTIFRTAEKLHAFTQHESSIEVIDSEDQIQSLEETNETSKLYVIFKNWKINKLIQQVITEQEEEKTSTIKTVIDESSINTLDPYFNISNLQTFNTDYDNFSQESNNTMKNLKWWDEETFYLRKELTTASDELFKDYYQQFGIEADHTIPESFYVQPSLQVFNEKYAEWKIYLYTPEIHEQEKVVLETIHKISQPLLKYLETVDKMKIDPKEVIPWFTENERMIEILRAFTWIELPSKKEIQEQLENRDTNTAAYIKSLIKILRTMCLNTKEMNHLIEESAWDVGKYVVNIWGRKRFSVLKADKSTNYASRDIWALFKRQEIFNPDKIVYVVGSEQSFHFKWLFKTARELDLIPKTTQLDYTGFWLYKNDSNNKLSSRDGARNADEFIQAIINAFRETNDLASSTTITEEEKDELARNLTIGSLIFNDLSNSPNKDITIKDDPEQMRKMFTEKWAHRVYFAYCRYNSILNKIEEWNLEEISSTTIDLHPQEKELLIKLYEFPSTVKSAAEWQQPNIIVDYMKSCSELINSMYNKKELKAIDNKNWTYYLHRKKIILAASIVLKKCMSILNMPIIEKM